MKIILDLVKCNGYGSCVLAAPTVFEIHSSGDFAEVINTSPSESLRTQVSEAARVCPKRAIQIVEG
jgi:ferredoxin